MKYRVGDKVRVRNDLETLQFYGDDFFTSSMERFKGQIVTIIGVGKNKYFIKEDESRCYWTEEMFEPVEYKPTITIPIDILKRWDLLLGHDGSNTKAMVRNDIQYLLKELERGADV